jgi:hypothetical protein
MLTDQQLEELAERMSVPLEGVYFKNELPALKTNKTYIINLQDSETEDGKENSGTHWTMLHIKEYPNGKVEPFYFDPYGVEPPEIVKMKVRGKFKKYLPYNNKDIQSLMNEACGYYCLAMSHYINVFKGRTGKFYEDCDNFLDMFDDLNKSIDWKKNEYILKQFFMAEDPKKRMSDDVFGAGEKNYDRIVGGDNRPDIARIPVDIKYMNKEA